MCGRFAFYSPKEAVQRLFGVAFDQVLAPRYNIAPTQDVATLRLSPAGSRELVMLHWGLVPYWAKELGIGNRMINARAETLAEKPAFRTAYRRRRCVVLASGFYEWHESTSGKTPFFIATPGEDPLGFAALWERWEKTAHPVESCTIITTAANATLRVVHERMPVVLAPEDIGRWLDPAAHEPDLRTLLRPAPEALLTFRAVSRDVNNPRFDDPALVAG